ncbi:MAG: uridine kinase [Bacteroidota bacterium]|nr:uridine kinase [Bacteroidota bacterium]
MENKIELSYYLISVCGGSASGKSLLLNKLRKEFSEEELCIISLDDYYKPKKEIFKDEKGIYNFDLPSAINYEQFYNDLLILSEGKEIEKLEYTFNNPNKEPKVKLLKPTSVILIEGLFVLHLEKIASFTDFKIFVEADEKIRFIRREKRDIYERGIPEETFIHQWNNHVIPAFNKYILPYKNNVDIVINNNVDFDEKYSFVINKIHEKISS